MVIAFMLAMSVWMLTLTYFVTKLSKASKVHELHLFDMTSKIRGLKLAVRILGARSHVDPD